MVTATKTKTPTVWDMLDGAPRLAAQVRARGEYMGACIVQAPGGWARIGPTWHVPGLGWVVVGSGVNRWNTTLGLAEIATVGCKKTTWHADGVAVAPAPNIVYAVLQGALDSGHVARCAELAAQAEEVQAEEVQHAPQP